MKKLFYLAIMLAVAAIGSSAATITYTYTGSASGSIGNLEFGNAAFTITAVADTANVVNHGNGVLGVTNDSASIDITGLGTYSIFSAMASFVALNGHFAGISHVNGGGADLIHTTTDTAFGTWDLASSIGPITGSGEVLQWGLHPVSTSGGNLFLSDNSNALTFQATVGETPEPGSIILLVSGLAGVGLVRFRFRETAGRRRSLVSSNS